MSEPVNCETFFGETCDICQADVWQVLKQAKEIICTLEGIIACPGAPAPFDGEYTLIQDTPESCFYHYVDATGFINFYCLEPPEESYIVAVKIDLPDDQVCFLSIPGRCETSFANDLVIGNCGDPVFWGIVGGHGGTAELRILTPGYMPHRFICDLEMAPEAEQFWNEHSFAAPKYNFSINSRRYSNQVQVQTDTSQIQFGMILMWYGTPQDLPAGFLICNGTFGTPDLRDLFVIGAGDTYAIGETDTAPGHHHAFTSDLHNHDLPAGELIKAGIDYAKETSNETVSGTTEDSTIDPPYFGLYYVMSI